MQDPEFIEVYEKLQPELSAIREAIDGMTTYKETQLELNSVGIEGSKQPPTKL